MNQPFPEKGGVMTKTCDKTTLDTTRSYIKNSWKQAIKRRDSRADFVLPYDYIPPCVDGDLTDLYYWDTYFTNLGLYQDGLEKYAYQNIEDLKFCLRKFGCVPNMCRADGADHASQPPLLAMMVDDYYQQTGDRAFLEDSYQALCTEYLFWTQKRTAPNGLAHYGTNHMNTESMIALASYYAERMGLDLSQFTDEEKIILVKHRTAEGESGEDHTPRFKGRANHVNPIDLNCYLYNFERTMSRFAQELGKDSEEVALWRERANMRYERMLTYCYDEETGVFFDYNYVAQQKTYIYCAACYLPYVFGLTKHRGALSKINERLILEHGVVSCQEMPFDGAVCQWGYPNAWAPHNYFAYVANKAAGEEGTAERICRNYLSTVADEFAHSGKLYEKYDAVSGGKATLNEYGTPEMLGWTAGVFCWLYQEKSSDGSLRNF